MQDCRRFNNLQGVILFGFICSVGSILLGIDEETLWNFMLNNRLFNYYVFLYDEHLDNWDKPMLMAVYQDYYSYKDEFKEKATITLQENYGVNNPLKSEVIRNRAKETLIERSDIIPRLTPCSSNWYKSPHSKSVPFNTASLTASISFACVL